MDDFSTNTGVELMFRNKGILLLGGINNGNLKPALAAATGTGDTKTYVERNLTDELALIWKASIDKQLSEDSAGNKTMSGSVSLLLTDFSLESPPKFSGLVKLDN